MNSFNSRGSDPLEEKVTPVADAEPRPRRNTDEDVEVELVSSLWSKFININNFLGRKSNGSLLLFIYTRNFIFIFILDCLFGIHKLYLCCTYHRRWFARSCLQLVWVILDAGQAKNFCPVFSLLLFLWLPYQITRLFSSSPNCHNGALLFLFTLIFPLVLGEM